MSRIETLTTPEGSAFARFMAGGYGRIARAALGAVASQGCWKKEMA